MTTLITGAGIIGCETARLLAARGERAVLVDRRPAHGAIAGVVDDPLVSVEIADVCDLPGLRELMVRHQVTRVVHTAALLSTAIRRDPLAGVQVNIMGSANVLEAARLLKLDRVVLASSATVGYPVFADFEGEAFPEDFPMRSLAHRPASIYAATKVTAEHLGLLYRDLYGVSTVSLRFAAVVGAWSGPGTSVPGQLLASLMTPAQRHEIACIDDPLLVWRGGEEFIDARDCARANVAALDTEVPLQGVYSIASGRLSSFQDFVDAVRVLHPHLRVQLSMEPTGGFAGFPHMRLVPSDISAAQRELGWTPRYALAETVAHFAPLLNDSTFRGEGR